MSVHLSFIFLSILFLHHYDTEIISMWILFDEFDIFPHVLSKERLCKSSYSSMECFGACTSENTGEKGSGAVVREEECSCGKSTADRSLTNRRSFNKVGSCRRAHSLGQRSWRPLLLFIPLRLGLSEINPTYYRALKVCVG